MKRMLPFYLVYLIIITMVVTGVFFSKYGTSADGSDAARVARPVLRYVTGAAQYKKAGGVWTPVTGTGDFSFTDVQPGDTLEYKFKVNNFEGVDLVNEVLLKYKIEISVIPVDILPLVSTLSSTGTYPEAEDGWVLLGMGDNISHEYTLTIVWSEGATGSQYGNKEQTIRITINAEQID